MFSVYDSKAEAFIQPFFSPNSAVARRMFESAANDPNTDICKFAEDYTLFEIGTFENDQGLVSPLIPPKSLTVAITLKRNEST